MWHLKKIPKILHCYWGGNKLLYLRYLTIKSFIDLNPDWQVILWCPEHPFVGSSWGVEPGNQEINYSICKDYFQDLIDLPITKMELNFEEAGFARNAAEVHKADYVRINTLNANGGVWTDLDILFFKPIDDLLINTLANENVETVICNNLYGHSTGFNMAAPKSKFYDILCEKARKEYRTWDYQCLGPTLFNKYFSTVESVRAVSPTINLDMNVVYAHNANQVKELIDGSKPRFTKESIGCHWYAGNSLWGKFFNQTKGGYENLPKSIITDLINKAR
jgi:mannosyltransferase OCH1-like enzyme